MGAFYAALGLLLGLCLGHYVEAVSIVFLVLSVLLIGFWSHTKGCLKFFAILFVVGLTVSLLYSYLPETLGKSEVTGMVVRKGDNYVLLRTWFRSYYVGAKANSYEVGDILRVRGSKAIYKTANYESRFDFAAYLNDLGVRHELKYPKFETLWETPFRIRAYELRFLDAYEGETRALLDSLLFGKKDYSSNVVTLADELNLLFVLSASGIFYSGFLRLIEKVLGWKMKEHARIPTLFIGLLFLPFALSKIGIVRVFLMRLFKVIDVYLLKKEHEHVTLLGLSAITLLAIDFHYGFQSGFLTGYGISVLLYFGHEVISSSSAMLAKFKGALLIRGFLIPLSLSYGGAIHLFGLPFMVAVLPLSVAILFFGVLGLLTLPMDRVLNPLCGAVTWLLQHLSTIDVTIPLPAMNVATVFVFYGLFVVVMLLSEVNALKHRNILVVMTVTLYAVSLIPIVPALSQSVTFINVGQGDCCLVQDGLTTVFIDTGGQTGFDLAQESLIPYLRKRRIYHIDAIIASHQDYDHVGAVPSLMQHFDVGEYVTSAEAFPYKVGDLEFHNYNVYDYTEENDKSLVLSLNFMDLSWVFTGDAPIGVEQRIIQDNPDLDCDVLKVGHHGSDTSTSEAFLDALTPSVAIISCGINNSYGHPTKTVLSRLSERGIELRRTDLEGTITFSRLRQ